MIKILLSFFLCVTFFITGMSPVYAQAYRSRLKFLENFAVRQYEAGNKTRAAREFSRILSLDPANATARKYLDKIASDPLATDNEKKEIEQIVTDISTAQQAIESYQNNEKDLANMIRDLISENDALYVSLSKRSREVAELRSKFYGVPYNTAYRRAMADMPIDRVPQRLHAISNILPAPAPVTEETASPAPAPQNAASEISQKEINALLADIAALHQQKKTSAKSPLTVPSEDVLQAKKKQLLMEIKTLSEKQERLAAKQKTIPPNNRAIPKAAPAPVKQTNITARPQTPVIKPSNTIPPPPKETLESLQTKKDQLVQEIKALSEKQLNLIAKNNAISKHTAAPKIQPPLKEPAKSLKAKKDLLLEKTKTMAEKQENLVALKKELTTINTGLKNANNRYLDTINDIDKYYRDIKGDVADKNYVRQEVFAKLLKSYAKKTHEVNTILNAVRSRDKALQNFKQTLAHQNTRIQTIDNDMTAKDIKVASYKSILDQYKNELERRAALIESQKKLLDMSDKKLTEVSAKVSGIEKAIQQNDASLAPIPAGVDRIKQLLLRKEKTIRKMNEAIALRQENNTGRANTLKDKIFVETTRADKLTLENKSLAEHMENQAKDLAAANERIRYLERNLENMVMKLKANRIPVITPSHKDLDDKVTELEKRLDRKQIQLENAQARIFSLTSQRDITPSSGKTALPLSPAAEDELSRARAEVAKLTAKLEENLVEINRLKSLLGIQEKKPAPKITSGQTPKKP
ncbi:MAG: hypothetical protein WCI27_04990 [Candidatus Omnitrophota bacterium]